jgi:hypothetical protein
VKLLTRKKQVGVAKRIYPKVIKLKLTAVKFSAMLPEARGLQIEINVPLIISRCYKYWERKLKPIPKEDLHTKFETQL